MDEKLVQMLTEAINRQTALLELVSGKKGAMEQTAPGLFGAGGVFSVPGIEPDVITAYVRPQGLISKLPRFGSTIENPLFSTLTGFTAVSGSEQDYPCEDAPAGYKKGCILTAAFGRYARSTQKIDFDKVKLQVNSGVNTDLVLRGKVLGLGDISPAGLSEPDMLSILTMEEMVEVGVQIERVLAMQLWQGTPLNNSAHGGWMEFPGLDLQIATGQLDAITRVSCPALDSDIKDFNYNDVCGTSPSIVTYLSQLEWYLRYNATQMGLDPTDWVIVMRPGLWFELTACWPCQYNTNRCASSVIGDSSVTAILGSEMVAERDRMRRGMTIDINGNTYPVVVDVGIHEATNVDDAHLNPGQYASSIYFVPLKILGNFPVTYLEYVDYTKGASDLALLKGKETFWTDRGLYSWAIEQEKWCYWLTAKIEPRVILRTPQLAGRIDNVRYEPLQHEREPFPDSPYFYDGGVSQYPKPSYHWPWENGNGR